jgi:dTDP-glucose 4,6-dehydratase
VGRLVCDNSRIRTYTDWVPDYDLERGLAETLAFLRQHLSLYRPGVYNV